MSVIITGANGSIAFKAAEYLFENHIDLTAILTVRDPSPADTNTEALRALIARYPNAKASIHALDLSSLANVKSFVDDVVVKGINEGKFPPVRSVICNAFYWNLLDKVAFSSDGLEKTFQVNHVAHAALVLRLLGHFVPEGGRVVVFSSEAIIPGKNMLQKFPPVFPDDLDELVKADPDAIIPGKGFHRYALSKLAATSWVSALNKRLSSDPKLSSITAVAMNPGNISDSRALQTNTPGSLAFMQKWVIQPFMPVMRALVDPTFRTSETAGYDVMRMALGDANKGERGYFTLLEKEDAAEEARDEDKAEKVWVKTLEWAGVGKGDTAVAV